MSETNGSLTSTDGPSSQPTFTPTERRILDVLADGRGHRLTDLHPCLCDDLGPLSNVTVHLAHIRRKLRRMGEVIISVKAGDYWVYQWRRKVTDTE